MGQLKDKSNYPEETEDSILLERIQQNDDRDAFRVLFKKYFYELCSFSYIILNDRDLAEDVVQSVFIYIWEKRKEINISSSIKAYLSVAVRNKSKTTIKQEKRFVSSEELVELPTYYLNGEQQLEKESLRQLIIRVLPESFQKIYHMKHVEGMKQREIAEELNISESTLEKKLSKIKVYLRKLAAQLTMLFILLLLK